MNHYEMLLQIRLLLLLVLFMFRLSLDIFLLLFAWLLIIELYCSHCLNGVIDQAELIFKLQKMALQA